MFTYSSIHNIKSRKKELAQRLNVSENTFRKYLGILKREGLVFEQHNTLRLSNRYTIYEVLDVEPNITNNKISERSYILRLNDINEDLIKLKALEHKKEQINYRNKERIKNILIEDLGTIYCPKIRKKALSKINLRAEGLLNKLKENPANSFLYNSRYGFVDDNMGCESIAKLIGKKSKSTANRFMKKLQSKGFISYDRREIPVENVVRFIDLNRINNYQKIFYTIKPSPNSTSIYTVVGRVTNGWTII